MRSERGYSLVELLVSMAIMLTVTGAIFSLVNPNVGISRAQPEYSDMQQRARVGADMLTRDLMMAGAGPYMGATTGTLTRFFAPIVPHRLGINAENPDVFKSDSITLVYVPNTSAQTTADGIVKAGSELDVAPQDWCEGGKANQLCGFTEGMSVLIFDGTTGSYDTFEITQVQDQAGKLQHRGVHWAKDEYAAGSTVVQVQWVNYYWDQNTLQLRRYDGIATDLPVLDNVVGLEFEYFGDPNPPLEPRPATVGEANCIYNIGFTPVMPTLAATTGSLVRLDPALFTNGPWCGAGTNMFDADLLRIRQVRARLRVQASDASMRPRATELSANPRLAALFARPGHGSAGGATFVPDYELRFEVTPRNLNLSR